MIEPIYTYAGLGFIIGVVVGLGLARHMMRRAERLLLQAKQMLHEAGTRHEHATQLYQSTIRESEQVQERVRRLIRGASQ